ncbi:MAG: hypothetical protein AAGN35_03540 [Bacteroidota bacterium]
MSLTRTISHLTGVLLIATLLSCVAPQLPPRDYPTLKAEITQTRDSLAQLYATANATQRSALLQTARTRIVQGLTRDLIPQWYGTEWDFNGTTQTPGQGYIACGYFVSTLLRDVGVRVERVRMAQQASLYIIRSLAPRDQRRDWSRISTEQFAARVAELPRGLYVVGLDIHTGFVLHDAEGVWFIHSSYGNPAVVVKEKATESAVLAQSNRFVLGRVDNDWLLAKWLKKEKIATVTG